MNTNRNYEPEHDTRISDRAAELVLAWGQDRLLLAVAAEHVLGFTSWADHAPRDLAGAMLGDERDQDARDLAFMRDLRARVTQRLENVANEQAEKESATWPSWSSVLRMRERRAA